MSLLRAQVYTIELHGPFGPSLLELLHAVKGSNSKRQSLTDFTKPACGW